MAQRLISGTWRPRAGRQTAIKTLHREWYRRHVSSKGPTRLQQQSAVGGPAPRRQPTFGLARVRWRAPQPGLGGARASDAGAPAA